jgi:hypothetical protein
MYIAVRPPSLFATRRSRTMSFGFAVAASAAAAGALTQAQPTGVGWADVFWSAALVAVLASFGATARRWTWFLPAGVAAAISSDALAVACAAVAIVIAFDAVLRDTRSRARGALVAGLGGIALLRAEPVGFHGLTAILVCGAVMPMLVSGYAHAGKRARARARRVMLVAGSLLCLVAVGALIGIVSVLDDLAEGARGIDGGLAAARDADDDTAAEQLGVAARAFAAADSTLSGWFVSPARVLPVLGPNLEAIGSLSAQASEVASVSSLAADDADVDSLRFVGGRLDPQAVADMRAPLERVLGALDRMDASVDEVGSPWLVAPLAERVERLDTQIDEAMPDAVTALNAVGAGPTLLGATGPQRYLVLFTTPVEARGRTGFPGNFAELVVDNGKLSMPRFGRIAELEQGGVPGDQRVLTQPTDLVSRYGRFDVTSTWRNLTMTPDFVSLAQAAAELYPQSGGLPINGVLSVDPVGLAALVRYTGPVEVEGLDAPLTAENTAQFLQLDQYVQFTDVSQRTDVLEQVARTTFDRLTTADLPGPRAVSEQLDPVVDGGHIQFTTLDQTTFLPLHVVGVTGQLPQVEQDGLTVTTANAGGSKIDLFLARREQYDVRWDPETGQVDATLQVTLENKAPADGLPDYVIGNGIGLPFGTNRSFVSIYSPFSLSAARVGGQPAALQSEVELERNVYSTFVDIPPGGTVDIELDLTGTIEGRRYRLDLPVQPFATTDQVEVSVEVAGGGDGTIVSPDATVEGGTARWSTTLDRSRALTVSVRRD